MDSEAISQVPFRGKPHSAIVNLPDELLANIFQFVRNSVSQNWEVVAKVCRWWRNVALKECTLWTEIKISSYRHTFTRARAYIERSGTALISVELHAGGDYMRGLGDHQEDGSVHTLCSNPIMEFVDLIRDHTTRIYELDLALGEDSLEILCNNLSFNLPSIQDLKIENYSFDSERRPIIPILNHLRLRTLSLIRVVIPFTLQRLNSFCDLRELSLSYQDSSTDVHSLSLELFLDILQYFSSQLVVLSLIYSGPQQSSSTISSRHGMIEMRTLKQLSLYNSAIRVATLLSHLIIPSTLCDLNILGEKLSRTSSHGLRELLPSQVPSLRRSCELHIDAFPTNRCITLDGQDSSPSFIIRFSWDDAVEDFNTLVANTINDIPSVFSKAPLKILHLTSDFAQLSSQCLHTMLDSYPLIQELQFQCQAESPNVEFSIQYILDILYHDNTVRGEVGPRCPRLDALKLFGFTLDVDWFDQLQRCLLSRQTQKLKQLSLWECRARMGTMITDWKEDDMKSLVESYEIPDQYVEACLW
ncbi:hypothetical protein ABKN59_005567 [Abortiporus biennis]